jgi:hypothetical protein
MEAAEGKSISESMMRKAIEEPKVFPDDDEIREAERAALEASGEKAKPAPEKAAAPKKGKSSKPQAPRIFSFPNLSDETELARAILASEN